jgi:hypothetical protein
VDAYAWIEFFLGSGKGTKVKELVETAEDAYTPDTVVAELARKYLAERSPEKLVRERLTAVHGASHVLKISLELALSGSKAYCARRASLMASSLALLVCMMQKWLLAIPTSKTSPKPSGSSRLPLLEVASKKAC